MDKLLNEIYETVDNYIKENGTIKGYMSNDKYKARIYLRKLDLKNICEELGYDWFKIGTHCKSHGFKTKEEFINYMNKIIDDFGRFPTSTELINNYGIYGRTYINLFGSYNNLRKEMGYDDKFVDKLGYKCSSSYELVFANYLIDNHILFEREQYIFENDGNYRCDFILFHKDGHKIYIEIWGLLKNNPIGEIELQYTESHKIKIKLYEKYNYDLKSFYIEDFRSKNTFIKRFNERININDLKHGNTDLNNTLKKDFTLDEIKMCINNSFGNIKYFPTAKELRDNNLNHIINSIYEYYGSMKTVAKAIGLPTKQEWYYQNHMNLITGKPNEKFNVA